MARSTSISIPDVEEDNSSSSVDEDSEDETALMCPRHDIEGRSVVEGCPCCHCQPNPETESVEGSDIDPCWTGKAIFNCCHKEDANYICMDEGKPEIFDQLMKWMKKKWVLPDPPLVVSIRTARDDGDPCKDYLQELQRFVRKIIRIKGAWILTSGFDDRVQKSVQQAVKEWRETNRLPYGSSATIIGITKLNEIHAEQRLMIKKKKTKLPWNKYVKTVGETDDRNRLQLNSVHTHLILIRKGSCEAFRDEFERKLAGRGYHTDSNPDVISETGLKQIPVIKIVVGNIPSPLTVVKEGSQPSQNNQRNREVEETQEPERDLNRNEISGLVDGDEAEISVAQLDDETDRKNRIDTPEDKVVSESDDADVDAKKPLNQTGQERQRNVEVEETPAERDRNKNVILDTEKMEDDIIDGSAVKMNHETDKKNQINTFVVSKSDEADEADIGAVRTAKQTTQQNQEVQVGADDKDVETRLFSEMVDRLIKSYSDLNKGILGLHWGDDELIKSSPEDMEDRLLWNFFLELCAQNKHLAIDRMMKDENFDLHNFIDEEHLEELYGKLPEDDVHAGFIYEQLKDEKLDLGKKISLEDIGRYLCKLQHGEVENFYDCNVILSKKKHGSPEYEWRKDPPQHFFIWAVLFNRIELAKVFWERCHQQLEGAVFAAGLLHQLQVRSVHETGGGISAQYKKQYRHYSNIAYKILDICWNENPYLVPDLLVRRNFNWGKAVILPIAYNAKMEEFLAHKACFVKLKKIWRGDIAQRCRDWEIMLFACFPPIMVSRLTFVRRRDQRKRTDESDDKAKRRSGLEVNVRGCKKPPSRQDEIEGIRYDDALWRGMKAPVVKFYHNMLYTFAYIFTFGWFLSIELAPLQSTKTTCFPQYHVNICPAEIVTLVFFGIGFFDEICQMLVDESFECNHRHLKKYWRDFRNPVDVAFIAIFIIAMILRYALPEESFVAARFAYCIAFFLLIVRFSQNFYAFKTIGPKLTMIHKMLGDLVFFLVILFFLILGFGISTVTLLTPKEKLSWNTLYAIFYRPYWQMYGEELLDGYFDGNGTEGSQDNDDKTYKQHGFPLLFLAVFMVLSNLLLINLLIAMFSKTAHRLEQKSHILWSYKYYSVVKENYFRQFLPFGILFKLLYVLRKRSKNRRKNVHDNQFCRRFYDYEYDKITLLVDHGVQQYLLNEKKTKDILTTEQPITSSSESLQVIIQEAVRAELQREFTRNESELELEKWDNAH